MADSLFMRCVREIDRMLRVLDTHTVLRRRLAYQVTADELELLKHQARDYQITHGLAQPSLIGDEFYLMGVRIVATFPNLTLDREWGPLEEL